MKKTINLLTLSLFAVFALGMMIASCTGPEGPIGPAGADGTDGTDGVDANSFCINCHTLDNKNAINAQFAMSSHGPLNGSSGYAGGRNGCAKCHSHQGATETMLTGRDTTAGAIPIPVHFNCETCHGFHMTLDSLEFPDYALRNNKPVSMMFNGHATVSDLPGTGNTCTYCHQPRKQSGFPLQYNGTDSIAVTSGHWGTHYGTQAVILGGAGGFEVPGSMTYENSVHASATDCASCHMNTDGGPNVGGHTFKMADADGIQNMAACTSCHDGATSFDIDGVQTEIEGLMHDLEVLLQEHKLLDETAHAIPYTSADGLGRKWTSNEAGAAFNYFLAHYEGSYGVHNYKYTKALLVNTIEMVEAW